LQRNYGALALKPRASLKRECRAPVNLEIRQQYPLLWSSLTFWNS